MNDDGLIATLIRLSLLILLIALIVGVVNADVWLNNLAFHH